MAFEFKLSSLEIREKMLDFMKPVYKKTWDEPYKAVHDMSKSLSGLKKLKYDKEHEHELIMYENTKAVLKRCLPREKR